MSLKQALTALAARSAGRVPAVRPNYKRWTVEAFAAQGGSKNADMMGYAGDGDFRWIADLARHQVKAAGLWMDEAVPFDFYVDGPLAAYAVSLKLAREASDREAARWIERPMRALLHLHAIAAVPMTMTRGWQMIGVGNAPGRVSTSTAVRHRGASTPVVGDRFHPSRAVGGASMGLWLSWAAAFPGRHVKPELLGSTVRKDEKCSEADIFANLGGVRRFSEDVDPAVFGLHSGDRERLLAAIHGDDTAAAECAAIVVAECPLAEWYDFIRIRTSRGGEAFSVGSRHNGNKPHCVACSASLDGEWRILLPGAGVKVGANVGLWVELGEDRVVSGAANREGGPSRVEMPRLGGDQHYGFRFRARRVERFGGGPSDPPPPPPPPPPDPDFILAPGNIGVARPEAARPLVLAQVTGRPALIVLRDPRTHEPQLVEAVDPVVGQSLIVSGVGTGVRRHLAEASGPAGRTTMVVESQGERQELRYIREHK